MIRVTDSMVRRAAGFVWLTGRVLDQRRLAYLTGDGDRAGVLAALAGYATADGGYAFGLEPDVKGPASQPLTVMTALALLDEVDALDTGRAAPACAWLGEHLAPDGGLPALLDSIRDYPRPPWIEPPGYAEDEFHYAYDFAPSPDSLAARWFTQPELDTALDHLAAGQRDDGGWQISWRRWAPTTESDARPGVTIEALRVLRAWDATT